jgi:hypothetical protein
MNNKTVSQQLSEINELVEVGFDLDDFLVLIACSECGHEHYFTPSSLPGGAEHCEYCAACLEDE